MNIINAKEIVGIIELADSLGLVVNCSMVYNVINIKVTGLEEEVDIRYEIGT